MEFIEVLAHCAVFGLIALIALRGVKQEIGTAGEHPRKVAACGAQESSAELILNVDEAIKAIDEYRTKDEPKDEYGKEIEKSYDRQEELQALTVKRLRKIAQAYSVKGARNMRKSDLIEKIMNHEES